MEPTAVNSFLDRFIVLADSAFGLIEGDVGYVLNALIVVSIVLAGAQWALAQEAAMAPFFRKILFVGFFAFLINNWNALATAINQSGAQLGLRAGGDGLSMPDFHNPGRIAAIGIELFGKTIELCEGMNMFSDLPAIMTIWAAAMLAALGFFALALQIFIVLIAFKVGALAAFVALPWGVFNGTSWVAERPIGWVAGSAIRLFVLAFIASVSMTFVETLPANFALEDGGALSILLFGLTVLALAWFGPHLASEVVQGQPNLAAGHVVGGAMAAGYAGVGAAKTALGLAGGALGLGAGIGKFAVGSAGRAHVRATARPPNAGSPGPHVDHSKLQPPTRSKS